MHVLRSYRLVPALLALCLVLTAAAPLVRHSCGMSAAEMATMPCCKDKPGRDTHARHADMAHGDATHGDATHGDAASAMPCHDAPATPEPPAPCPNDGPAFHDTCCFTADAPTAPTPERAQLSPSALVALAAAFVLPTPPPADTYASPPADASPPAPVALHVLYGSFLT